MLKFANLFSYLQLPSPGDFAETDAAHPDARLIEALDLGNVFQVPSPSCAL